MKLVPDNWSRAFLPEAPVLELVVRGACLYCAILILMRIMPRRTAGDFTTMDIMYVVLIAQAAAHSLGGYSSIPDGVILMATLMGLNYCFNYLSFRFPVIEKIISAPALMVIKDGKLLRKNMRREFLTMNEILEKLREDGIEKIEDVKCAYVESDGSLSIIPKHQSS